MTDQERNYYRKMLHDLNMQSPKYAAGSDGTVYRITGYRGTEWYSPVNGLSHPEPMRELLHDLLNNCD